MDDGKCLICDQTARIQYGQNYLCDCPNCGRYKITSTALALLQNYFENEAKLSNVFSYAVRRIRPNKENFAVLNSYTAKKIMETAYLPDIAEQADNLLLHIGSNQESPGRSINVNQNHLIGTIGASVKADITYLINELEGLDLIQIDRAHRDISMSADLQRLRLSFGGWQRYHVLKKETTNAPRAFMAMSFSNQTLTTIVDDFFRAAVVQTGFELIRLDDNPVNGSIDERLRVEIRRSTFLISDLTDANSGAYWEAGFAEGIGKPVIFLCEQSVFEADGTHFDTNHHHTILWDKDDPERAVEDLKATIRASLPELAIMED